MANLFRIFKICPQCNGEGNVDTTDTTPEPHDAEPGTKKITCPRCNGDTEIVWGRMEKIDET